jgi:hypothetical protein
MDNLQGLSSISQKFQRTLTGTFWPIRETLYESGVPIPFDDHGTPDMSEVARIVWAATQNDPLATSN